MNRCVHLGRCCHYAVCLYVTFMLNRRTCLSPCVCVLPMVFSIYVKWMGVSVSLGVRDWISVWPYEVNATLKTNKIQFHSSFNKFANASLSHFHALTKITENGLFLLRLSWRLGATRLIWCVCQKSFIQPRLTLTPVTICSLMTFSATIFKTDVRRRIIWF